uniref:Replication initiator protein n=1 Tax=Dulem virus 264 TaxID=3145741 RepID=A0AAU8B5C3_9VIRU
MCTNISKIRNKYTGQTLYVPCGRCSSCLQQKASRRAAKIKNHFWGNKAHCYFITLTYDNKSIPFLSYERLLRMRDNYFYREFDSFSHAPICRLIDNGTEIFQSQTLSKHAFDRRADIIFDAADFDSLSAVKFIQNDDIPWRDINGELGDKRIGVLYKPDFVNFIKRLRINYERIYNESNDFKYFVCGEYGPTTYRPHFHLLLWTSASYDRVVRAVTASWPFSDKRRLQKGIEVARKPADYVSSYLNGSLSLPLFLKVKPIQMSCSHSKDFGVSSRDFQLSTILDKFYSKAPNGLPKRVVTYDFSFSSPVNGKSSVSLLLPQYVRDRYVPNFVGRGRLSYDALSLLFRQSAECVSSVNSPYLDGAAYDPFVFRSIVCFIHNKYVKYWKPLGYSPYDFSFICVDLLCAFRSHVLFGTHFDELLCEEIDLFECYDNIEDYFSSDVGSLYLDEYMIEHPRYAYVTDPNKFLRNILNDDLQQEKFHKFDKSRKIKFF